MSPTVVTILMVAFVAVFIAIDIVLAVDKDKGNTYSEILRSAGKRWMPLVMMMAFGMGLLCGHWWW